MTATGGGDGAGALSGYPVEAPALHPPTLFDQTWADLTFLHWPVRPDAVAHLFPTGTRPDVFGDGLTYVALVPFRMRDAALRHRAVPYFGTFAETNIRLYSVDAAGRHGVLFRSLDCARAAVVLAARAGLGVPYAWARMQVSRSGDLVRYASVRRWPHRGLRSRLEVRVGPPVEPTPLEVWLTARWGAHSRAMGRTLWTPNRHERWPLHGADLLDLDDDLLGASGVEVAGPPLRPLWSPGVHASFGLPVRVT